MDAVGYLLGGLVVFGFTVNGLLKRVEKSSRKFPWCRIDGRNMQKVSLPKHLPDEVLRYLDEHQLPAFVVSRYICPNGCYQLWFIPKLGNTERAFFLREQL